jgi:uncharacterized protein (DUF342 family)
MTTQNIQNEQQNENWVPLLDYAVLKGISTSTIRRYIKANKIEYKIVKGRYLLKSDTKLNHELLAANNKNLTPNWDAQGVGESVQLFQRIRELEEELKKSREQISELKMLIAAYEEKLANQNRI